MFEHELAERLDELLFASPSHRSVAGLAAGLEGLSRARQEQVLRWAGIAAQTYAEIGHQIASLAPRAFELLDSEGFDAWALAGLDSYDRQGLRPAMERLRGVEAFAAERAGRALVRLSDVEARLGRFLHGLSGRALAVKAGNAPWTDTESVFLPASLAEGGDVGGNWRRYRAISTLLWAQSRFGTFSEDLEAVAGGYGERREQALGWLALLESIRLEARIADELPGIGQEIAALRGPWPRELLPALATLQAPTATVGDTVALLPGFIGQVPPRVPLVGHLDPAAARRVRSERIARETLVLRRALAALKATAERQATGEPRLTVAASVSGPAEVRLDGEVVALPAEAAAAAQSLLQDLGELPAEALTPAGPGGWVPTERSAPGAESVSPREAQYRYDEWDHHRHAFRRRWCHVYEHGVAAGDGDYVAEVRRRHGPLISSIRRRFEALRGEDRQLGRQTEGEEVDVDALVEALGDRCGGNEPSARLYCRRVRNERSLAAMFMVDMSGSTKGWVNDAEREALVMLCEALETLGDAYAIYGFSGWTRTRCDIYRIKTFAEAYTEEVRGRIAGIEAKDYTRMGVAIRHLTTLLAAQAARHKLLVTLSDGRPDDFGDEYRSRYGIEDTRHALLEARAKGIRSYCVTIDRHAADYLSHMYGPASYTVLDDVKKLPLKLADIYRRLAA